MALALALALSNMALALALVAVLGLVLGFKDNICGLSLVGEKQKFGTRGACVLGTRLYDASPVAGSGNL